MALADIPFYGAYTQRRQMNDQAPLAELAQASQAVGLLATLQKQKKQQQYDSELAALGPEPPQEKLVQLASKYAGPEKMLDIHQKSLDRQDVAAARREAIGAKRDLDKQMIDLRYDTMAQQATNEDQKRMLEQRRIEEKAAADRRHDETLRLVAGMNADLKREIAANKPEKPMTEFQGKSSLYGTRAAQSDKILRDLEDKISLSGLATKQAAANVPGIGGVLGTIGNTMLSSEQQRVEQAQRDFVNAVLRQESGAVISESEFENARKQYFPAPGDTKEVLAQKRANRKLAIEGFKRMAGAGGADIEAIQNGPLLPGGAGGEQIPEFATEVDAAAAKLKPGTRVRIGGKLGTWH